MSDLKEPIDTLKEKVELLIGAHGHLATRLKELEDENQALKNEAQEQAQLIKDLQENNKIHNLAQQISSESNPAQNAELKLIITDLVKEIDKCIALLGKSV